MQTTRVEQATCTVCGDKFNYTGPSALKGAATCGNHGEDKRRPKKIQWSMWR